MLLLLLLLQALVRVVAVTVLACPWAPGPTGVALAG
jgi:hypothetical protein